MKKILFYALAACAALSVGCSKDAGIDQQVAGEGKYTLPAITASLDDAETRTGEPNATTGAVNWSTNDRLAVINTSTENGATPTIYYYRLSSGAGTSIGKFEPVGTAATFNDINDIKAVYPAIAADVDQATGAISVSINTEPTKEKLGQCGITSWTANSSAYAFGNNDIKVSYNTTMTTSGSNAEVNFKFRQLATWCKFEFNFPPTYKLETMESIKVTTTAGTKMISGKAEIDFAADPQKPTLKTGTDNFIEWKTSVSLGRPFTVKLMLFPVIKGTENATQTGDQLKFEITTNEHKFTFYATPSTSLAAGTVLRFPFNVGDNFEKSTTVADFKYLEEKLNSLPAFYYYGEANCKLLTSTSGTLDITPHKTNNYYWNVKEDATGAPIPNSAKVIWKETSITGEINCNVSGNTLSVSKVEGTGNVLVGIYDASDNLLWSYHFWKPEIDPTKDGNLLTYDFTNSGTYEVMPIALGAIAGVDINATQAATANTQKTFGLYYQWGRKDPMGRPASINAGGSDFVAAVDGAGNAYKFNDASHQKELKSILKLQDGVTTVATMKYEDKTDGVDVPVDYYMIDYAKDHPTEFIMESNNINSANYNWTGKDNPHLWGNPQGDEWPRKVERSIFDPCPAGWRVAPKDLWIAFTKSGQTSTANASNEDTWAENILNIANINTTTHMPSLDASSKITQRGYFFFYQKDLATGDRQWRTGKTDFYPASGFRERTNGSVSFVGSLGFYWSSSPNATGDTYAGDMAFNTTAVYPLRNDLRAYGFAVRCVREKQRASR